MTRDESSRGWHVRERKFALRVRGCGLRSGGGLEFNCDVGNRGRVGIDHDTAKRARVLRRDGSGEEQNGAESVETQGQNSFSAESMAGRRRKVYTRGKD